MISSSPRTLAFALALAASLCAFAAFAGPASASPCGTRVLKDWLDNSRIDGTYPLHCYQDAIDQVPSDIRDYSDAVDVISAALRSAGGHAKLGLKKHDGSQRTPQIAPNPTSSTSSPSSFPIPLLVLGGVALALLAAGGYGYVSRRRRAEE
jgi:hypothetical protein